MKKLFGMIMIICCVAITFSFTNVSAVSAAVVEFKTGTYTSSDGHTIVINDDKTVIYDGTYSLTLTEKDRGSIITGKLGTNNVAITLYQINDSKMVTGSGHVAYAHDGEVIYLYNFTVFSLNSTPLVLENSGIELYRNGFKVNSYADIQSAVDAANDGDIIKITKNLDAVNGTVIAGKNLTIDGGNHTLNSSTWANSIFIVDEDATLTINNLTIDGGSNGFAANRDFAINNASSTIPLKTGSDINDTKQNLSALISKGNLIVDKLNMNNIYTKGNGAAIQSVSGNITLNNSNFNHNRANKGGSIYIGSNFKKNQNLYPVQNVILKNVKISDNYSTNAGGLFIYNADKINIKNSAFFNNTVTGGKGGGILFYYQPSTDTVNYGTMGHQLGLDNMQVNIDNCMFEGNWVGNDGYAIENQGAEMLITNTKFSKNYGMVPSTSVGTVSNIVPDYDYYSVTLKNCVFEKNEGGVSAIGDHATMLNLVVKDTKFIENKGWQTMLLYTSEATFKNCEFIREKTTQGVLVASSMAHPVNNPEYKKPKLIVDDCTFIDTKNGTADIQIRKYNRNIENNTATLYLEGKTSGNVHIWDDNRLIINGSHIGNIYKDSFTSADEGIIISDNATIDGEVYYNNDKYTYTLVFWDLEDGYEYRRYLYLDKNKTYTRKEFFMEHFISSDGYVLEYYTDSSFTTPWDYTAAVSTNKVRIYGKWIEHTHNYTNGGYSLNNSIHGQCECGHLGKRLSIDIKDELYDSDIDKEAKIINELGVDENDYVVSYMMKNNDGTWSNYEGIPNKIGDYKVILTYKDASIEKEYRIIETPIKVPATVDNIGSSIIMFISSIIGLVVVIGILIKSKKVCEE